MDKRWRTVEFTEFLKKSLSELPATVELWKAFSVAVARLEQDAEASSVLPGTGYMRVIKVRINNSDAFRFYYGITAAGEKVALLWVETCPAFEEADKLGAVEDQRSDSNIN